MRPYYFVSGLPRAGSTLLCNILAQNPRFYATHTSGLMDMLYGHRNRWGELIEHRAAACEADSQKAMKATMQAIMATYWPDAKPEQVVFDKGRGWLPYIEIIKELTGEDPKILVPVRDIRDVLASFEKLWRATIPERQIALEREMYFQWQTVQGRALGWCRDDQPVGLAINRIRDAVARGYKACLHFVEFEELTFEPDACMQKIYAFLGEEPYEHDFNNVEQVTSENDQVHGLGPDLHKIQNIVKGKRSTYAAVLGKVAEQFAGDAKFWQDL